MLDVHYQNQGIGKIAGQLMLDKMAELPNAKRIVAGFRPENKASRALWKSFGFVDEGHRFGQEMAMIKRL